VRQVAVDGFGMDEHADTAGDAGRSSFMFLCEIGPQETDANASGAATAA
jgi:hypothetical protein